MPRKGENIYKRKDGRWEGRFIKQRTSDVAKYGYIYGKSYLEVKKKLEFEKVQCYQEANVQKVVEQVVLFKEICELWLADIRPSIKESSYIRYRNIISTYIIMPLGDIATSSIDYALLSSYVSELLSTGGKKETGLSRKTVADILAVIKAILKYASRCKYVVDLSAMNVAVKQKNTPVKTLETTDYKRLIEYLQNEPNLLNQGILICAFTGIRIGDDDDKIRLNQRKPSKYKGLRRFGPEKNLQRINKFMKERPIFYKNFIQMKENFRFYLRCFYCITKVVILQFNSENRTELARNG